MVIHINVKEKTDVISLDNDIEEVTKDNKKVIISLFPSIILKPRSHVKTVKEYLERTIILKSN